MVRGAVVGDHERREGGSTPLCEQGAEILDFWTGFKKHWTVQKGQ